MSHFGSLYWPNKYGVVADFRTIAHEEAVAQTTLFTVPADEDGAYRITAVGRVRTVGTGADQTWDLDLEVNNGTAQTTVNFLDGIDALTANANKSGLAVYYLASGATIKYTTNSNGTETTEPIMDIEIIVERI